MSDGLSNQIKTEEVTSLVVTIGPNAVKAIDEVRSNYSRMHTVRLALWLFVKVVKLCEAGGCITFRYPDGSERVLESIGEMGEDQP